MTDTVTDFWTWLDDRRVETGHKSYRQLELAAGLSNGAIGSRHNDSLVPTAEMCIAIAPVLQVSTVEVLERAGFRVTRDIPGPPANPALAELWALGQRLAPDELAFVVRMLRGAVKG